MRRNLVSTLAPMILSVLSLGSFMVIIIFQYTGNDLMRSNVNLLDALTNKIELILRDMESYNYNFSSNPTLIVRTKEIVSSEAYSYGAQQSNLFINNIINTPVNTNPYLYSVYIYYYNYNNLLCSGSGLVNINDFYDREWVEGLKNPGFDTVFFHPREIKPHSFDKEPTRVLTLNRPLYSPGASRSDGIITLNLDANYVENMIHTLEVYKDQLLLIIDSRGQLILSNVPIIGLNVGGEWTIPLEDSYNGMSFTLGGKKYLLYKTVSSLYGIIFLSLVPLDSSYQLTIELVIITILALVAVTLIGFFIAALTTRHNRDRLIEIIGIFSDYEKIEKIPDAGNRYTEPSDVYDYIVNNILGVFIREHRMKVQLDKRKYQRDLYELKALQAQINPHFLYNTLETLSWKTMELTGGYTGVNEIIENLSAILKYCLSNAEEKVKIRDEIEYTKRYMAIQNIRYGGKYRLEWEYNEKDLDLKVMKLLFQPFIENSMKHGGQSNTMNVEIKIKILHRNNYLHISIIDNGTGMDSQKLTDLRVSLSRKRHDDSHIGLINTNQRLRLLYGDDFSIKILSRKDEGTRIYFSIPLVGV
ncbi:hypothetical protein FACS1894110_10460 [Spirochaetia bacterium]|nr:hypothetical protein FACS1894110_10460 [Spirochaetia bacterium]